MIRERPSALDRTFSQGEHLIWLTGAALAVCLLMIAGLLVIVVKNGAGYFQPHPLTQADTADGGKILGVLLGTESFRKFNATNSAVEDLTRSQFKLGNRDVYGIDFKWFEHTEITNKTRPSEAVALERDEYGDFYGYLTALKEQGKVIAEGDAAWAELQRKHPVARSVAEERLHVQKVEIGRVNAAIQEANIQIKRAERRLPPGAERDAATAKAQAIITTQQAEFEKLKARAGELQTEGQRFVAVMRTADGKEKEIPLAEIVRAFKPNAMSSSAKAGHYLSKVWEFTTGEPRESNTEGGIFPAIFGTVVMTLLMSIAVVPFGVLAALYLREYAKQGFFVRCVRIAVNNLAGVPSIVFGVFGLGFFVYFVGGTIDQLFYPELLPTPTYGTGGILWASLTLALLTVPVVIVATEESIAAVPRGAKEGSLALGASKFQTLCRIVLPASLPGILTGLILAMARGAGEVAPLMITGVVKLAPTLPLDATFPFFHLDRKFMHLGFHIYDVGFQSPNVEAAKPMVFTTTLLLLFVVVALNLAAILIRDRIRKKYRTGAFA
ncbi:MAG: phosphate ABC transporter permease PstA [Verrucomicrobia bacterium]|jgi:phosphate transport system permease protein|nr:phosphate ABC transporter permease PstA [Verrucomicrobiota bacterium]